MDTETQAGTTWGGLAVRVVGATVNGRDAERALFREGRFISDGDAIKVRVAFEVKGPIGPNDPPWGPMREATVELSELSGPVEYPNGEGFMVVLRAAPPKAAAPADADSPVNIRAMFGDTIGVFLRSYGDASRRAAKMIVRALERYPWLHDQILNDVREMAQTAAL
jgi:hypothetical protein